MVLTLQNIFIVAEYSDKIAELHFGFNRDGFACSIVSSVNEDDVMDRLARQTPDLVLVELNGNPKVRELSQTLKQERKLPIMALLHREALANIDGYPAIDDFVIEPYDIEEIRLRSKRLLNNYGNTEGDDIIRCGDLVIDKDKCEVSIDGDLVKLTFREYELLRFMATNKGRVYTREALLNKVWGYDYYGGDRTVDVHVRRLRSKLEGINHSFFDTVRNIGYRFRKDD